MKEDYNQQTEIGDHFNSPKFHTSEVLALFRPGFTRNEYARLVNFQVLNVLQDPNWRITQDFETLKWSQIFDKIQQSYCRRFFLMNSNGENIIGQITRIKFGCLKHLDLSCNKITNVEGLSFLRASGLKAIILKDNYLININSLVKNNWRRIQFVNIQGNFVKEWKNIASFYLDAENQFFIFQFLKNQSISHFQDITTLYVKPQFLTSQKEVYKNLNFFNKKVELINQKQSHINTINLNAKKYQALKRRIQINNLKAE